VADALDRWPAARVVDPVLRASDGTQLLEPRALRNLCERIVAGSALVTPNLDEALVLTGTRDPERAAAILLEIGAEAALVKGGHADGPADDYLLTAQGGCWLRGERRGPKAVHGTGCALSAAIAARLSRGEPLGDAVRAAKAWVGRAIEDAYPLGRGQAVLGLRDAP
jgi:hydroxymethylpyrimidine/phosphomethylpyrimidine kinase